MARRITSPLLLVFAIILPQFGTDAFVNHEPRFGIFSSGRTNTVSSLNAIGVLARKAKEADVRQYCEGGVEDDVLAKVEEMKKALPDLESSEGQAGPLQQALTKRKGTITVIAEYKRRLENAGYVEDVFEPEVLSPTFREFGAAAVAVLSDPLSGNATYDDIKEFSEEQKVAEGLLPGPLPVICSDLIVDEVQIARAAANGASAVLLTMGLFQPDQIQFFMKATKALNMEPVVSVANKEEANKAASIGATIIMIGAIPDVDERFDAVSELPDNVCKISAISVRDNKQLEEVEEAWICRDKGFNAVWVSDALYKSGNDPVEHPGAIINSMRAKSSVKWASPKARSGKGEGSREYLGDILM